MSVAIFFWVLSLEQELFLEELSSISGCSSSMFVCFFSHMANDYIYLLVYNKNIHDSSHDFPCIQCISMFVYSYAFHLMNPNVC